MGSLLPPKKTLVARRTDSRGREAVGVLGRKLKLESGEFSDHRAGDKFVTEALLGS